jgi:hypothetical protein
MKKIQIQIFQIKQIIKYNAFRTLYTWRENELDKSIFRHINFESH